MAKTNYLSVKVLETAQTALNYMLVKRSIEKTDLYDFYIAVAKYRYNYLCYGQINFCDINKTLTINNLLELNVLLHLFKIKTSILCHTKPKMLM